jgi:LAS superfamily LD-carboxypeptidase LdcB
MYKAAKKEGITLKIISATRPFLHQKRIWEAKWSGVRKVEGKNLSETIKNPVERALKILEFSSMPGTSRHHWGTDIDINTLTNEYFEKGQGLSEYNWLVANAASFGFCQPYSPKGADRKEGYNEEKWHWSYLPLAKKLTDQYKLRLKDKMINGFKGAETATEIGVIKKYVLGINQDCL